MIEYGRFINGQLVRNKSGKEREDDKEIIYTEMPVSDFVCVFRWEEQADRIVQVWTQTDRLAPPDEITDEESLTRYANKLTGADDPDLLSAAETLITDRIKEDM